MRSKACWFEAVVGAALVAMGTAWPVPAAATSASSPMSVEALTRRASHVVRGTVRSMECYADRGQVFTRVEVEVQESLKGAHSGTVLLRLYGGTHGGRRTFVVGGPSLARNEEVVLFLQPHRRDPTYGVVGLAQGKFQVVRRPGEMPSARRDLSGIAFQVPPSGREAPWRLSELAAAVRAAAR